MKNRFGNVTYDSTLSQGLCPTKLELDTLAHTFGFSFEFQDGITFTDTLSVSLPAIQAASLTQVVQYIAENINDAVSVALPAIQSASLIDITTPVAADFEDSLSTALPSIQSASLSVVVRIHTLYDAALSRPEDTLEHTPTWEFTLT